MTTHSSILAWEIPWTEEPGRLHFMGCKELDTTERSTHRRDIKQYSLLNHNKLQFNQLR